MKKDPIMDRNDLILEKCEDTMNSFVGLNKYLEDEHKENRLLFLNPVIIKEPESPKKRNGRRVFKANIDDIGPSIDPLEVALEQIDYGLTYKNSFFLPQQALDFQNSHNIEYYRNKKEITKENTISKRKNVNTIPNSSSVFSSKDNENSKRKRLLRMRKDAISLSLSANKCGEIRLPKEIADKAYKPLPNQIKLPSLACITNFDIISENVEIDNAEVIDNISKVKGSINIIRESIQKFRETMEYFEAEKKKYPIYSRKKHSETRSFGYKL